jgi:DNA-binding response OmpR family regulator
MTENGADDTSQNDRPLNVLLVDDEVDSLELLARYASRAGFHPISAESARQALIQLDTHKELAAVMVDITMPKMDGISLTRQIRASLPPYIPVIFTTGLDDKRTVIDAIRAGGDDYLIKPIRQTECIGLLRELIELGRRGELPDRRARMLRELERRLGN